MNPGLRRRSYGRRRFLAGEGSGGNCLRFGPDKSFSSLRDVLREQTLWSSRMMAMRYVLLMLWFLYLCFRKVVVKLKSTVLDLHEVLFSLWNMLPFSKFIYEIKFGKHNKMYKINFLYLKDRKSCSWTYHIIFYTCVVIFVWIIHEHLFQRRRIVLNWTIIFMCHSLIFSEIIKSWGRGQRAKCPPPPSDSVLKIFTLMSCISYFITLYYYTILYYVI